MGNETAPVAENRDTATSEKEKGIVLEFFCSPLVVRNDQHGGKLKGKYYITYLQHEVQSGVGNCTQTTCVSLRDIHDYVDTPATSERNQLLEEAYQQLNDHEPNNFLGELRRICVGKTCILFSELRSYDNVSDSQLQAMQRIQEGDYGLSIYQQAINKMCNERNANDTSERTGSPLQPARTLMQNICNGDPANLHEHVVTLGGFSPFKKPNHFDLLQQQIDLEKLGPSMTDLIMQRVGHMLSQILGSKQQIRIYGKHSNGVIGNNAVEDLPIRYGIEDKRYTLEEYCNLINSYMAEKRTEHQGAKTE